MESIIAIAAAENGFETSGGGTINNESIIDRSCGTPRIFGRRLTMVIGESLTFQISSSIVSRLIPCTLDVLSEAGLRSWKRMVSIRSII